MKGKRKWKVNVALKKIIISFLIAKKCRPYAWISNECLTAITTEGKKAVKVQLSNLEEELRDGKWKTPG